MSHPQIFKQELSLIQDEGIQATVEDILANGTPEYFWTSPSSITGKHHPPDEQGVGGLVLHSRKVAWHAYQMFGAMGLNTDIGVAAALLHDIRRYGKGDESSEDIEDYKQHGNSVAFHVRQWTNQKPRRKDWDAIILCVKSHMGKYGPEDCRPAYEEEKLFHLADLAASCKLFVGLESAGLVTPDIRDVMESGKHFIKRNGEWVVNFGKYKGEEAFDLIRRNPGYFGWMLKQDFAEDIKVQVREIRLEYDAAKQKETAL